MNRRVGLYPGTFDPIHKGHIGFALAAAQACQLDIVAFLPEHTPRGKQGVTPLSTRTEQIEAALMPHSGLTSLSISPRQFTYQSSMPELRAIFGEETEFTLLMGSDVAKGLAKGWEDADKLFRECDVAVGLRNDDTADLVSDQLLAIPHARSVILKTDFAFESSTRVKRF